MKKFFICLTFDTDSDPDSNNFELDNYKKDILGWSGFDIGSKSILKKITKISKENNILIPMTWFIRIDDQIKSCQGSAGWIYKKYNKFWKKIIKKNGSIQWHIHLNSKINNLWTKEHSIKKMIEMLTRNYKYFEKIYKKPDCIRIGEAFMNQSLSKKIQDLGIKADSSALPGRKRFDNQKKFDWLNVKNQPYFMSTNNYKRAVCKINKKNLLEIPMNTIFTKCSYDKKKIKRYVNLSFYNNILKKNLGSFIKKKNYLITMTHPFEIVKKFKNKNNSKLVSFSINEFEKNIRSIINLCKKNKKKPLFININEVINNFYVQRKIN
jgi:hypothetical protein